MFIYGYCVLLTKRAIIENLKFIRILTFEQKYSLQFRLVSLMSQTTSIGFNCDAISPPSNAKTRITKLRLVIQYLCAKPKRHRIHDFMLFEIYR